MLCPDGQARPGAHPQAARLHFHNDFGHSVVNTIAGLAAGASVAHMTMNGIGERAGNTPMEETVISLLVQYGVDVGLHYEKLFPTAQLVRQIGGFPVADNRPVTGERLFHVNRASSPTVAQLRRRHIPRYSYRRDLISQALTIVFGKPSGTARARNLTAAATATDAQVFGAQSAGCHHSRADRS
jgi:hypothetical protein